jgi:hypothetical protein
LTIGPSATHAAAFFFHLHPLQLLEAAAADLNRAHIGGVVARHGQPWNSTPIPIRPVRVLPDLARPLVPVTQPSAVADESFLQQGDSVPEKGRYLMKRFRGF